MRLVFWLVDFAFDAFFFLVVAGLIYVVFDRFRDRVGALTGRSSGSGLSPYPSINVVHSIWPEPEVKTLWYSELNIAGNSEGRPQATLPKSLTISDVPAFLDLLAQRIPSGIPVKLSRGLCPVADHVALQARERGWEVTWFKSPSFEACGWQLCRPTVRQDPSRSA